MSGPGLQFRVEHEESEIRLVVIGEVDLRTAETLLQEGRRILAEPPAQLVLDLSGVPFCDSIGLSALVALRRACDAGGCRLVIAAPQAVVAETLAISGLEEYLGVDTAGRHVRESDTRQGS